MFVTCVLLSALGLHVEKVGGGGNEAEVEARLLIDDKLPTTYVNNTDNYKPKQWFLHENAKLRRIQRLNTDNGHSYIDAETCTMQQSQRQGGCASILTGLRVRCTKRHEKQLKPFNILLNLWGFHWKHNLTILSYSCFSISNKYYRALGNCFAFEYVLVIFVFKVETIIKKKSCEHTS